ncbi:MAG: prolyl oligopeptidase family serine peptidase [Proteobacteria bacterium]|nr:prolyl oligopeptidase family serine peptidase [Pseudomonadota bacterium]
MPTKQKTAFGSWKSPITTDLMLKNSVGLGEISMFDNDIYWIEMRPHEKGRYVIVKQTPDGQQTDVIPPEFNARTRVHEYGGGSYIMTERGLVFANFSDQCLYLVNANNDCLKLTNREACRYADMIYDKHRHRIICVREDHSDKTNEAKNTIVEVSLSEPGIEKILFEGADFYSNPRISYDGKHLCWISWQHPNMPWDDTAPYIAEIDEYGVPGIPNHIAGGDNEALCQPVWAPDGILYFVSDRNNWWNLYRYTNNGIESVIELKAEFAVPQWLFRECNYDFIDKESILAIYRQQGLAYIGLTNVSKKSLETFSLPFTDFESLVCSQHKSWFLAASPNEFSSIVEYDIEKKAYSILRKANNLCLDQETISVGESLSFPVANENEAYYAFFYRPKNKDFIGLDDEKPPLIVISHGGPTGESHNGIKMVIQFFTSRGIAVLDVNYGGSSGYGREFRQRLNGQWGIVDVNDCSKAALYVAEQGWVDKERLAIRGGSAGGFTTLAALAFTEVFKAGASHYGVSDLEALAKETHKFESRYLDSLIGAYPEEQELYKARSPINAVDKLSCPVIFFQGLEDKIVLPNQAKLMVDALKRKGIPVAHIEYEGEQHGFRQAKNIKRTLEAELYFYSTVFNFECVDEIEPVEFL